jgi:hypothetical protein
VIGAITGVRSMAGLATLAQMRSPATSGARRPARRSRSGFGLTTALFAAGEAVADKAIALPARTEAAPLIGRGVLGAVAAGFIAKQRGTNLVEAAVIGGATALLTAVVATGLRRVLTHALGVRDPAVGLAEDALVLAGSAWILDRHRKLD